MELSPKQQEELDEFREEHPEIEVTDAEYLEFDKQNPNREFTLHEYIQIFESEVSPSELLQDAERVAELTTRVNDIINAMTLDNIIESISNNNLVVGELEKLMDKYEATDAEDIFDQYMKDRYGIDFNNMQFVDIEAKIDELEELAEQDPDFFEDEFADPEALLADADKNNPAMAQALDREKELILERLTGECDPVGGIADCTLEAIAVEGLKEQYQKLEEMRLQGDIPRDDMIAAYKTFLSDRGDLMDHIERYFDNFDDEAVPVEETINFLKDQVNVYIGIPSQIFGDGGIHFAGLLADRVKEFADQAEQLKLEDFDGRDEYLEEKLRMYQSANSELARASVTAIIHLDLDVDRIEMLSGYSERYLDEQIEIIKLEQEVLKQANAADEVNLESYNYEEPSDTELGTIDDPSANSAVAGNIIPPASFKV